MPSARAAFKDTILYFSLTTTQIFFKPVFVAENEPSVVAVYVDLNARCGVRHLSRQLKKRGVSVVVDGCVAGLTVCVPAAPVHALTIKEKSTLAQCLVSPGDTVRQVGFGLKGGAVDDIEGKCYCMNGQ